MVRAGLARVTMQTTKQQNKKKEPTSKQLSSAWLELFKRKHKGQTKKEFKKDLIR